MAFGNGIRVHISSRWQFQSFFAVRRNFYVLYNLLSCHNWCNFDLEREALYKIIQLKVSRSWVESTCVTYDLCESHRAEGIMNNRMRRMRRLFTTETEQIRAANVRCKEKRPLLYVRL